MELNTDVRLVEVIEFEKHRSSEERYASDGYCIYWRNEADASPGVDDIVFIGAAPEISDDDEEIFPAEVVKRDWWLAYRDELIQDVVDNALHQKPSVTNEEIVHAIQYYNAADNFWNFVTPEDNVRDI